jgi:hypothetical protein
LGQCAFIVTAMEFGADGPGFAIHDREVSAMHGAYRSVRSTPTSSSQKASPAEATLEEGDLLYAKLVAMIVGEVTEGLAKIKDPT